MAETEVETHYFKHDGQIPNNQILPVLFYPAVLKEKPEQIIGVFENNHWRNSWTGGVFDYHHYHSNTHEVLGVISGTATLQLGGHKGKEFVVNIGDVLVLPAGTGHKRISQSEDFQVAGAYPDAMDYDLKTEEDELISAEEIEENAPLPDTDPVFGNKGPLLDLWKKN